MAGYETKCCTGCKQDKPLADFPPDQRARDGRQPACRICTRERNNASYRANYADRRAKETARYWADIERSRAKARENSRKYAAKNCARATAWIKANRERFRANMKASEARRRSAEKAGASGPETRAWFNAQKKVCHWCGIKCAEPVIDHIMPIALDGKHEIKNLAISCRSCNAKKSKRHPIVWAQLIGKLL